MKLEKAMSTLVYFTKRGWTVRMFSLHSRLSEASLNFQSFRDHSSNFAEVNSNL